jgi:tetratricopeptide (TPR) repeat protein
LEEAESERKQWEEKDRMEANASGYHSRGIFYEGQGKFDDAIGDYTEAIRFHPNYPDAYYIRGNAYRSQGKSDEAEANFAKADELRIGRQ